MQKWEYKVMNQLSEAGLNKLGAEGWELVAITFDDSGRSRIFYFKRSKD